MFQWERRTNPLFSVVSRAFQILSDSDKKAKYDKFGGDPDNRFSGASAPTSPFSGFARSPGAGGPMFEEEISPEEMFRQFFGGGMGGFGGGPFGRRRHISRASFFLLGIQANLVFCWSRWRRLIRRWPRVRLQHRRRTWYPRSSVRRRPTAKTTTWRRS